MIQGLAAAQLTVGEDGEEGDLAMESLTPALRVYKETGSHITQASLKLAKKLKLALNS